MFVGVPGSKLSWRVYRKRKSGTVTTYDKQTLEKKD